MSEVGASVGEGRQDTAEHLLRTAERLFAVHGVDAVSLRQIVAEAGHRNPAAIQYHFGSKDALLRAILEYRLPPINERRLAMLAAADADGHDLRSLVEAVVVPLLELEPAGAFYVRFLARFVGRRADSREAFAEIGEVGRSGRELGAVLRRALDHLPPAVQEQRMMTAFQTILNALAGRQEREEAGVEDGLSRAQFVTDLIDATVGLLAAPSSIVR